VIKKGSASSFEEFIKDTASFNEDILPRNAIYYFSNRWQEAFFGRLKANDKKFLGMLKERLGDVAVCQIKKTADWLRFQPDMTQVINDAKLQPKAMVTKRKNNKENSRNERLSKLMRIAPVTLNDESDELTMDDG
jgi:hypothetical protein